MIAIARAAEQDGTFRRVFYMGAVKSPEDFLTLVKSRDNCVTFVFRGREPIGVGWLNAISDNHATVHFYFLANVGADALRGGRMLIEYWMSFTGADGEPLLDVLIGAVPVVNTSAIEFGKALGFVHLGSIPRLLRNAYSGAKIAAALLYYVRPQTSGYVGTAWEEWPETQRT